MLELNTINTESKIYNLPSTERNKLHLPLFKPNFSRTKFQYTVKLVWNNIPKRIKISENNKHLHSRYRDYQLNK